ncbi:hypothetical protein MUK42_33136 [Musa troglodytarum]|uniref:Uncharacterized protein n=1 Tax=Musa troglodytarum TaxID=320322 RepID=A0A9E7GG51_9LILI|nr:hypothetical protein MUK42_33136 [Musa troglodytarum]
MASPLESEITSTELGEQEGQELQEYLIHFSVTGTLKYATELVKILNGSSQHTPFESQDMTSRRGYDLKVDIEMIVMAMITSASKRAFPINEQEAAFPAETVVEVSAQATMRDMKNGAIAMAKAVAMFRTICEAEVGGQDLSS